MITLFLGMLFAAGSSLQAQANEYAHHHFPRTHIQFRIMGQDGKILFGRTLPKAPISVGEYTVQVLDQNRIPYRGDETGLLSIWLLTTRSIQTPSGEIRHYGWCYAVDGMISNRRPNEIFISERNTDLLWFYGYITARSNGEYRACVPARSRW